MLGNKVYIVASSPKFYSACTHSDFVAINVVNALAVSSNKQTFVSHCGQECSLERIGGSKNQS
jgi:hypothetical protein